MLRHRYLQFFEMLEDDRREINIRNTNITDILGSLTGSKVLKLVLLLPWNRNTDIENGHVITGQEGDGGMNWEVRIDIYTLPCIKQTASGKLLSSAGSLAQCSVGT